MLKTEFKQKMSEVLPSMSIMETTEGALIGLIGNGLIFSIKLYEVNSFKIASMLTHLSAVEWFLTCKLIKEFAHTPVEEREP